MKKIFKTIVALSLLLMSVSCDNEGFFELERPNQYPWATVKELELAVRQPYLLLMGNAWVALLEPWVCVVMPNRTLASI